MDEPLGGERTSDHSHHTQTRTSLTHRSVLAGDTPHFFMHSDSVGGLCCGRAISLRRVLSHSSSLAHESSLSPSTTSLKFTPTHWNRHPGGQEGLQASGKDLSPSLRKIWVCPSQGSLAGSFLPLRWMERKRILAKEREGRRGGRGPRPKGSGARPRCEQTGDQGGGGCGEGGCWRGPAPGAGTSHPLAQEQPRP